MRLFGDILPYIGFRNEETTPQLRAFYSLYPHIREIETFQIGWFGCYIVYPIIKDEQVMDHTD